MLGFNLPESGFLVLSEPAHDLVYQPDQIVVLMAVLESEQQGRDGVPPGWIITRKRFLVQEIMARLGLPLAELGDLQAGVEREGATGSRVIQLSLFDEKRFP